MSQETISGVSAVSSYEELLANSAGSGAGTRVNVSQLIGDSVTQSPCYALTMHGAEASLILNYLMVKLDELYAAINSATVVAEAVDEPVGEPLEGEFIPRAEAS